MFQPVKKKKMKRSRVTQQAFASLDNIHHRSRLKALDWERIIKTIIIIKQVSTNHVKLSSENEKKNLFWGSSLRKDEVVLSKEKKKQKKRNTQTGQDKC